MKFVFGCDDVGGARGERPLGWFRKLVDWLDAMHIPGTFFWVPKPGGRPADPDGPWMQAIRPAREHGHDFQLHGLTHHCLEFGVPQESIRRHNPRLFEDYEREKEKWDGEHTVPALEKRFAEGIQIYERAFGERPLIFRAPCLGMCANAYAAMSQHGLAFSSSRSVNPDATGYVLTRKPELVPPWHGDYDGMPYEAAPGVTEIPLVEDLAIGGFASEDLNLMLDLFKTELRRYLDGLPEGAFGVFSSHYQAIGKQFDLTTRLYERLFEWLAGQGVSEWTTLRAALR